MAKKGPKHQNTRKFTEKAPRNLTVPEVWNSMSKEQKSNVFYWANQFSQQMSRNKKYSFILQRYFKVTKRLGNGSFGVAYQVRKILHSGDSHDAIDLDMEDSYGFRKTFAIKIIPNYFLNTSLKEIQNLSGMCHPNIVRIFKAWEEKISDCKASDYIKSLIPKNCFGIKDNSSSLSSPQAKKKSTIETCLFLQYEFCSGGDLEMYLVKRDRKFSQGFLPRYSEAMSIISQIIEGLVYLQFHEIVHGDLKPDNIFLTRKGYFIEVKLGDFGLSKSSENYQVNLDTVNDGYRPTDVRRRYTVPEHLKSVFVCKGDIYAFGLIFMELLVPFKSKSKRIMAVLNAMDPLPLRTYPLKLSEGFQNEYKLIQLLLSYNISKRLSALELKERLLNGNSFWEPFKFQFEIPRKKSLIPLAKSILNGYNKTGAGFKILSEVFYKLFLVTNETELKLLFSIANFLTGMGCLLNKLKDDCYRGLLFLTYIEIGSVDHRKTVDRQVATLKSLILCKFQYPCCISQLKGGILDIDELCDELEFKIVHSSAFQALPITDKIRLDFKEIKCIAICEDKNSTQEDLNCALNTYAGLFNIYESGNVYVGTQDEEITSLIIREQYVAKILRRLRRMDEASEIYDKWMHLLCEDDPPLFNIRTVDLLYFYAEFLALQGEWKKARTLCEALFMQFAITENPELNLRCYNTFKLMIAVYNQLGFHNEVDFLFSVHLLRTENRLAFNDVMSDLLFEVNFAHLYQDYATRARESYGLPPNERKPVERSIICEDSDDFFSRFFPLNIWFASQISRYVLFSTFRANFDPTLPSLLASMINLKYRILCRARKLEDLISAQKSAGL